MWKGSREFMLYNVAQLLKADVGTSFQADIDEERIHLDDEEIFPIDEHHQVDLTEAVRQNVLLAIPMVTLCREDCPGLCPQCGHDLSLGPCECQPEVDTRLSILEKLLQNGSQL